jgi:hypothetical protein
MERTTSLKEAKRVMDVNFLGPLELALIANKMGIIIPNNYPEIPFGVEELVEKRRDYILVLGLSQMKSLEPISLKSLRNHFGIDPDVTEPCFYNQDWYLKEDFAITHLETKWALIRKEIYENTRGKSPEVIKGRINLPSAVLCAFVFFAYYFHCNEYLWKNNYVWCCDHDHIGDRIYIGRYFDLDFINKNGFSIHRHLSIRNIYGAIDQCVPKIG